LKSKLKDGTALQWINSCLTNRPQVVAFGGVTSFCTLLRYGVPQGSVLEPLLFLLYTAGVASIAHGHGVLVHCYANDTQLYTCSAVDGPTTAANFCGTLTT